MRHTTDKLIAARPFFRVIAALNCLIGLYATIGLIVVLCREHLSGWELFVVAILGAVAVLFTTICGFVAIKGRGPSFMARFAKIARI